MCTFLSTEVVENQLASSRVWVPHNQRIIVALKTSASKGIVSLHANRLIFNKYPLEASAQFVFLVKSKYK